MSGKRDLITKILSGVSTRLELKLVRDMMIMKDPDTANSTEGGPGNQECSKSASASADLGKQILCRTTSHVGPNSDHYTEWRVIHHYKIASVRKVG